MRSFIYLSKLFPDSNHIMPDAIHENFTEVKIPSEVLFYVPVECYGKLECLTADLFSNFFSFGEMPMDVLCGYLRSSPYKNAKLLYLVNRVVSSPTFEHVYDNTNVLDYCLKGKISIISTYSQCTIIIFLSGNFWPQSTKKQQFQLFWSCFEKLSHV